MTDKEKAKAFDEALERFHQFKEKYCRKETHFGDVLFDKTGEMQKDFDSIFPQLAESEEQMSALADTLEDMPEHYKPKCTIESLERDLKKLM